MTICSNISLGINEQPRFSVLESVNYRVVLWQLLAPVQGSVPGPILSMQAAVLVVLAVVLVVLAVVLVVVLVVLAVVYL